jgi:hypothetical protein
MEKERNTSKSERRERGTKGCPCLRYVDHWFTRDDGGDRSLFWWTEQLTSDVTGFPGIKVFRLELLLASTHLIQITEKP